MEPQSVQASSSNAASQPHEVAQKTRLKHDALVEAMQNLEAALASAAPGRELVWNRRVVERLRTVADQLAEHARAAESSDSSLAEVDAIQPALKYRVERLRQEHANLLQQAQALRKQIENHGAGEVPNFRDIRQRATWLLNALRHHQAAETDLIFEAFFTDIGVGD
jgi:hypothetical protein